MSLKSAQHPETGNARPRYDDVRDIFHVTFLHTIFTGNMAAEMWSQITPYIDTAITHAYSFGPIAQSTVVLGKTPLTLTR